MAKSQTSTKSFLISSSLVVLAGLSSFISKLKETLHLTSDYIKTSLSRADSTTKTALRTSIIIMQNRKWAEDELRKIDVTLKNITESEELTKQLEEKKLKLNSPTPNFKGMTETLHKKQIQLADFIKQLDMFERQQNQFNQNFLTKCDAFKQEIADIYKKLEIEFSEKEFGEDVSEIMK
ncbi:MAG: hypothetical protein PVI75_04590 [Gammaproteobacteria bacterium]|jgi:hypothetical protein